MVEMPVLTGRARVHIIAVGAHLVQTVAGYTFCTRAVQESLGGTHRMVFLVSASDRAMVIASVPCFERVICAVADMLTAGAGVVWAPRVGGVGWRWLRRGRFCNEDESGVSNRVRNCACAV